MRPDEHVLQGHPGDEFMQGPRRALAEARLDALVVEAGDDVEPCFEQPLRQRFLHSGFGGRHALAEEIEIAAEVEDEKVLLVPSRSEEIRVEASTAADHLPELRRGP